MHLYERLTPERILQSLENLGFTTTGHILALNSYENRVYDVGVEDAHRKKCIVKFYRPKRWSDEAVLEEHAFCFELAQCDIPVVAPLIFNEQSLHNIDGFRYAVFEARGGRAPEIDYQDTLKILGHFVGRIHALGATKPFKYRETLSVQSYGIESAQYLLENNWLPLELTKAYESLSTNLLKTIEHNNQIYQDIKQIRIHADLHGGNILMNQDKPHIVDLDDCRMGPAIQDIWMFLSGDIHHMSGQLNKFLEGYREFHTFDARECHLIETLRTLRMMHYAAWLARRWDDPAFPKHFPWFNTQRYWEEHILQLKEQLALLQEPPLFQLSSQF